MNKKDTNHVIELGNIVIHETDKSILNKLNLKDKQLEM